MIFDLFHSISDPVVDGKSVGPRASVQAFLDQAVLAESLGMDTVWLAESHFSSETQKTTSVATIPNFFGEVGLNVDSYQFLHLLHSKTKRINFGTGIHNIVGGSGGPIASAERVRFLHFINTQFWEGARKIRMGVASGRFPYQNTPFGIIPRNKAERDLWNPMKRYIFVEALEIFLRLLRGESLSSDQLALWSVQENEVKDPVLKSRYKFPVQIERRWKFESLKLVPEQKLDDHLEIVLGSHCPLALEVGMKYWDLSLFNLSFTPPEQIEKMHQDLEKKASVYHRKWTRCRLPRTVMVFIDRDRKKAQELANSVLDTYVEAMRGTAQVPDKAVLLQRALVGDAAEVRDQILGPERGFHPEDRLMLWFEFNQLDSPQIQEQMKYFFKEVVEKI